jgi:hypothetical protein
MKGKSSEDFGKNASSPTTCKLTLGLLIRSLSRAFAIPPRPPMADHEAQREQEVKDMHDSDAFVGVKGTAENGDEGLKKGEPASTPSGDVDQKEELVVHTNNGEFDPVGNLQEEQKEALEKMKSKISKYCTSDEMKEWCNEMCLLRYLRARDYNVQKAKKVHIYMNRISFLLLLSISYFYFLYNSTST